MDYEYSLVSVANSGKPCLNNCEDNQCIVKWDSTQEECTSKPIRAPKYFTSQKLQKKKDCLSNCATFGNEYAWCMTMQDATWDYCNPMVAYEYEQNDVYGKMCLTACIKTKKYYACDTDLVKDQLCAPPAKPRD